MSQQRWLNQPKASMYDQLLAVDGVTNVEYYEFKEKIRGVYVEGGSDEDIAKAMSMHIYRWNSDWFVGDTSVVKAFFTAWFYRDYNTFIAKQNEFGSGAMPIYKVVLVDNHTKERKVWKEFDNILEACDYIDDIESQANNEHDATCFYGEFKVDTYK